VPSTHRIYLQQDGRGRWVQTDQPTSTFYDVDVIRVIEEADTRWIRVSGAGMTMQSRSWQILRERVPDGATDGIVIDDLGATMKLIRNHWYVDQKGIHQDAWVALSPPKATCLQWLAGGLILIFGIVYVTADRGSIPVGVTLAVAGIVVLMLIVDALMKWRMDR
jgi:hypothetical protein